MSESKPREIISIHLGAEVAYVPKSTYDAVVAELERVKEAELDVAYERNVARKERDEWIAKYNSIELANKEMSRNDHVVFGMLLQSRDELRAALNATAECFNCSGCRHGSREALKADEEILK